MSDWCGVCSKFASTKNDVHCTGPCKKLFHLQCIAKLRGTQPQNVVAGASAFCCDDCTGPSLLHAGQTGSAANCATVGGNGGRRGRSPLSVSVDCRSGSLSSAADLMYAFEECSAMLAALNGTVQDLVVRFERFSSQLEDINNGMVALSSQNRELTERCEELKIEKLAAQRSANELVNAC